jgi:hypothetical protein
MVTSEKGIPEHGDIGFRACSCSEIDRAALGFSSRDRHRVREALFEGTSLVFTEGDIRRAVKLWQKSKLTQSNHDI